MENEKHNTGVTIVMPGDGNLFKNKFMASSHVINGFGNSSGLVQVNELGTIETSVLNVAKFTMLWLVIH